MKQTLCSISIFLIVMSFISCRKDGQHLSKSIVIDTALVSGREYLLNLQPYGDADDTAAIQKQGTLYTVSEITNSAGIFAPVYHYLATVKSAGNDQVILSVKEGLRGNRRGNNRSCDSTKITINFSVK